MSRIMIAPWTAEQVEALEILQAIPLFHGYTCGTKDAAPHPHAMLVPTVRGWICPYCTYKQDFAERITKEQAEQQKEDAVTFLKTMNA
jgi:hypothetical protein